MAEIHSKSRQQAEIAFGKAQSQLLARGRPAEDRDASVLARAEKTLRLRQARLKRDATATTSLPQNAPGNSAFDE